MPLSLQSSGFPLLSLCFDESLNARVLRGTFLTIYLRRKQKEAEKVIMQSTKAEAFSAGE